jgi:hypothetical protein
VDPELIAVDEAMDLVVDDIGVRMIPERDPFVVKHNYL